ncbi:MAG: hypothetical protein IKA93_04245 [Elusimicrobiaceae bacterium]|nr:hypothetical protein [Elusimicrobiaceae bacterium]
MAKDIVQVEINRIPLEVEAKELGVVELTDLAASVEKHMFALREEGEIDTLKQALITALHFAAQAYLQNQHAGGKRLEEESRVNDLIFKLRASLENPHK